MTDDGSGKGLEGLLQAAQRVQQELGRIHDELANQTVEGAAGGGMVVAVANGRQQLLRVRIDREVVNADDIPMLEDLVLAAVNAALTKSAELARQEVTKVTGPFNLGLPGTR